MCACMRRPQSGAWELHCNCLPFLVQSCAWDPHNSHLFVASAEDGVVKCFDARNSSGASVLT